MRNNRVSSLIVNQRKCDRKTISLTMNTDDIGKIDAYLKSMCKIEGKYYSRNYFIEMAVREFLSKTKNIIDKFKTSIKEEPKNQVIIFTCSEKGGNYNKMFKNQYWQEVSLGEKVRKLIQDGTIKYFALYRGVPHRYIDSYAEIININKLSSGKYKFELGNIKMLDKPVLIKEIEPSSFMKGRRITLEKLLTSTIIKDIDRI